MKRKLAIVMTYILNPGDGKPVETWHGPHGVEIMGKVMPRYEDARAADPFARLFRVVPVGRLRVLQEWSDRDGYWWDVEDQSHIPIKVLEAAAGEP